MERWRNWMRSALAACFLCLPIVNGLAVAEETGGTAAAAKCSLAPPAGTLTDTLRARLLPSASPPHTLKLRASKQGVNLFDTRSHLQACIKIGTSFTPTQVEQVTRVTESGDVIDVAVAIPRNLRPLLWDAGSVAVSFDDGTYFGTDDFWITGFVFALLATLALGTILFFTLRAVLEDRSGFSLRWFTGPDGKASLSLFQIFIWTCVVLFGLAYVAALTGELFALTPQVLALLGIAGIGSVAARFVSSSQGRAPAPQDTPKFSDVFRSNGAFDLYKLQMFLFTVGTALFVAIRIAFDQAFPELETNLLLLLGISNGLYVGAKAAEGESPFREAERLDVELKTLQEAKANADAEVMRLAAEIASLDARIAAAPAGTSTDQLTADRALRAKSKADAEARVADLVKRIADTTAARQKAIAKL